MTKRNNPKSQPNHSVVYSIENRSTGRAGPTGDAVPTGERVESLDRKIEELMTGLYWDAKCGRAAAEYNLKNAGMIEMIFGHVAGKMSDGDNFWDDCRWTLTERGRCTSMADLQRIILA
jgi:hypothetical protein